MSEVRPSLEGVFGSKLAHLLMAVEGGTPSRMNREGAARSYHMYAHWGYFNRCLLALPSVMQHPSIRCQSCNAPLLDQHDVL